MNILLQPGSSAAATYADALTSSSWELSGEMDALSDLLQTDEIVEHVARGRILEAGRPAVRRWLVVVTNRRLLCVKGSTLARRRIIDVPHNALRAVRMTNALLQAELHVRTRQGTVQIRLPTRDAGRLHAILGTYARDPELLTSADAAAEGGPGRLEQLEGSVERLESDLARLQQQVDFLENLLRGR